MIYHRLADDQVGRRVDESKALVENLLGEQVALLPVPVGALDDCPCPRCQG